MRFDSGLLVCNTIELRVSPSTPGNRRTCACRDLEIWILMIRSGPHVEQDPRIAALGYPSASAKNAAPQRQQLSRKTSSQA
jgi:hypothetical protein